jgi:hypothetical protein
MQTYYDFLLDEEFALGNNTWSNDIVDGQDMHERLVQI